MSRIIYNHKNLRVNVGWEPFQTFFLLIEDPAKDHDDVEQPVWDNLWTGELTYSIEQIASKLSELNIPFPDPIVKTLLEHKAMDIGNEFIEYLFCEYCSQYYLRSQVCCDDL